MTGEDEGRKFNPVRSVLSLPRREGRRRHRPIAMYNTDVQGRTGRRHRV